MKACLIAIMLATGAQGVRAGRLEPAGVARLILTSSIWGRHLTLFQFAGCGLKPPLVWKWGIGGLHIMGPGPGYEYTWPQIPACLISVNNVPYPSADSQTVPESTWKGGFKYGSCVLGYGSHQVWKLWKHRSGPLFAYLRISTACAYLVLWTATP